MAEKAEVHLHLPVTKLLTLTNMQKHFFYCHKKKTHLGEYFPQKQKYIQLQDAPDFPSDEGHGEAHLAPPSPSGEPSAWPPAFCLAG